MTECDCLTASQLSHMICRVALAYGLAGIGYMVLGWLYDKWFYRKWPRR
jgi:hypothetical protein